MNPFDIIKNAKEMRGKLEEFKKELDNKTVTGISGGGLVKIEMTCSLDMVSIVLDPIAVDNRDIPMLQDLIKSAYNDAVTKAKELTAGSMNSAFNGLPLEGLFV